MKNRKLIESGTLHDKENTASFQAETKETRILSNICFKIEEIISEEVQKLRMNEFVDGLNKIFEEDDQDDLILYEASANLIAFYDNFRERLSFSRTWVGISCLLKEASGDTPIGNYLLALVADHPNSHVVNIQLQLEVADFIQLLKKTITEEKEKEGFENIVTQDRILFSNEEIISALNKKGNVPLVRTIEALVSLRNNILTDEAYELQFNLSQNGKIYVQERRREELVQLVESKIFEITPSLFFHSNSQIRILERELIKLNLDRKVTERFNALNLLKSQIDYKELANQDNFSPLKKNSKPADVIRFFETALQKFHSRNEKGRIRLWINYLFLGVEGFSFNHLKRASLRKTKIN